MVRQQTFLTAAKVSEGAGNIEHHGPLRVDSSSCSSSKTLHNLISSSSGPSSAGHQLWRSLRPSALQGSVHRAARASVELAGIVAVHLGSEVGRKFAQHGTTAAANPCEGVTPDHVWLSELPAPTAVALHHSASRRTEAKKWRVHIRLYGNDLSLSEVDPARPSMAGASTEAAAEPMLHLLLRIQACLERFQNLHALLPQMSPLCSGKASRALLPLRRREH